MATGRLPDPNTAPVTAKGDLYTYSTVPAKLAVGNNGETLVADSSATTGLRWQGSYEGGKNLVINGNMLIAQRGTSTASVTNSDSFPCIDRFQFRTSNGTYTVSQDNDAPVTGGKSLKVLVTTASSPSASERTYLSYNMEGQDVQRLRKGTSGALPVTLSFWVKSNVTGTFTASLYDRENNRLVSAAYTITSSATWEYKTITFPADLTGTITADNGRRLEIYLNVSGGTNYTSGSLQTTWATYTAANWMVGQTNLTANLNNYINFTNVQLEAGSVATQFSTYSGTLAGELQAAQRYYQKTNNQSEAPGAAPTSTPINAINASSTLVVGVPPFKVTMRTSPTVTLYSPVTGTTGRIRSGGADVVASAADVGEVSIGYISATGLTAGSNSAIAYVASAEL